jgi:hypothetical protein
MRILETFNCDVMQRKTEQCMQMVKSNCSFHRRVPALILHFITNQFVFTNGENCVLSRVNKYYSADN